MNFESLIPPEMQSLADSINQAVWMYQPAVGEKALLYCYANAAFFRLLRLDQDTDPVEALQTCLGDQENWKQFMSQSLQADQHSAPQEASYPLHDDRTLQVRVLPVQPGLLSGFFSLSHHYAGPQDTTLLQSLLKLSTDLIYIYDIRKKINIYSNNRIADFLGYSIQDIQDMGENMVVRLMHPEDLTEYLSRTLNSYSTLLDHEVLEHSYRMRHRIGDWRWLQSREMIYSRDADGTPLQILGIARDITRDKRAENRVFKGQQALMQSEERYRKLFENMTNAFALHEIVTDENGLPIDYVYLEVNPAFEKQMGLQKEAILGRRVTQIIPGIEKDSVDWIQRFGKVALYGHSENLVDFSHQLGKWFNVTAYSPQKKQFVVIFTDITEQKQLEEQLRQAEKLQAVGQLAGGIAHDFNNQLTSIMGYSELLQMELSQQPELLNYTEHILLAVRRASDLTVQLLAFARKGKYQAQTIDLNSIAVEIGQIVSHTFDRRIHLETDLSSEPCWVKGDVSQIQNALMNLVINARDAMPEGGVLGITTRQTTLAPEAEDRERLNLPPGKYVCLEVKDSGTGMEEGVISHIFEPFFTTKEPGKGTGMGLAAVYGTMHAHSGNILVESSPGAGSRFRLFFPYCPESSENRERKESIPEHKPDWRILIVDDEDLVRNSTSLMLQHLGCTVTSVSTGSQAVQYCQDHPGKIDLVLLDMVMPDMSGKDTYHELIRLQPGLKVVLCSGYSRDGETQQLLREGVKGFLQKPFRLAELLELLDQVMHES